MNPIRRKMVSFLTETAYKEMAALDAQSTCAKELSETEDVDEVIAEEIEKICNAATLAEIMRVFTLASRIKKASGRKKEAIKRELDKIAEQLVARVETESGQLRFSKVCRHLLLEF